MRLKTKTWTVLTAIVMAATTGHAQTSTTPAPESKYDYHEAFNSRFYTTNGNEYRTAGGQPGHAYWQNRTDYQIAVSLNETTDEVKGTATLSYTNNSPDALPFFWLYLEQNLFAKDSRGAAVVPVRGSRYRGMGDKYGMKIKSVKALSADGKTMTDAKYIITDTRMQVWLPKELAAKTVKPKLVIEYAYICPEVWRRQNRYPAYQKREDVQHSAVVSTHGGI